MNIKEISERFKIRCSAIGKIMTNGRGKVPIMGKTCESYCLDWIKEQPEFYHRKKEFSNKYTEKGLIVEDDSIDFVSEHLYGGDLLLKHDGDRFENEFMTGMPDVIQKDEIIDVKSSWDWSTFPVFATSLPSTDYYWQAQGYMHLVGRKKYRVIYCLMNTPENIILREATSYSFRNGYGELEEDMYQEFVAKMTYDRVAVKNRIRCFDLEFEQGAIDQIEIRVGECREFIFNTLTLLGNESK